MGKSQPVRPALYFVNIDSWYVERAGWGVAGIALGIGTLAAAYGHSLGFALLAAVGLTSFVNALTGFCPVSTALGWLGLPARLVAPDDQPTLGRVYRMRRDHWYLERTIYVVVGFNLTLGTILALVHSPWWLAFTGFVSFASVTFSLTGFCPVANVLYRMGFEPRLARTPEHATT